MGECDADSQGSRAAASPCGGGAFLSRGCRPEEAPATERVLERPGGHSGRRSKFQIVWVGVMGSFFCDAKFIINLSVLKDVGHKTLGVIELLFLQQSSVLKRPWA